MYSAQGKLWTSGSCCTEEISILQVAVTVLLSLFRVTLCVSFVQEPECHQSRGAAASQLQRRCSLKQGAVGRKNQPSSSNCCHLWKRRADTISERETQEDCSFGLSFHSCSPKRLRSRVTLATSHKLTGSRNTNGLSFLHYPAQLSFLTLPTSLIQYLTQRWSLPCNFLTHPGTLKLFRKGNFFACRTETRQEEYKTHSKVQNWNNEKMLELWNSVHGSKGLAGGTQPQQGGQRAATHCFQHIALTDQDPYSVSVSQHTPVQWNTQPWSFSLWSTAQLIFVCLLVSSPFP